MIDCWYNKAKLAIAGCLLAGATVDAGEHRVVSWRQVSDRSLSPLASSVMREARRTWTHAESARFIYHVADATMLEQVVEETEWVCNAVGERLGLADADEKGRLFLFSSAPAWDEMIHNTGRRSKGAGLNIGREIYVLRDPEQSERYVDIAHEMVHFRLQQAYGDDLPLWLEEGLAEWLGWEVAAAYQLSRGLRLYRESRPTVPPESALTWPELMNVEQYPAEKDRNRAFYRQSRRLIDFLAPHVAEGDWTRLIEEVTAAQGDLEAVLRRSYDWSEARIDAMKAHVTD